MGGSVRGLNAISTLASTARGSRPLMSPTPAGSNRHASRSWTVGACAWYRTLRPHAALGCTSWRQQSVAQVGDSDSTGPIGFRTLDGMALAKQPAARQAPAAVGDDGGSADERRASILRAVGRSREDAGLDAFVERLCALFYDERLGRPNMRPRRHLRLLFIGYFEMATCSVLTI